MLGFGMSPETGVIPVKFVYYFNQYSNVKSFNSFTSKDGLQVTES